MQECASRNEDFQCATITYFQATSLTYKLVFVEQRHFCLFTLLSLLKILIYLSVGQCEVYLALSACIQLYLILFMKIYDRQTNRLTDRQTGKQTDRQRDEQTDRQRDTDRKTDKTMFEIILPLTDRQTDRQTDRLTERQKDRQTDSFIIIKTLRMYRKLSNIYQSFITKQIITH